MVQGNPDGDFRPYSAYLVAATLRGKEARGRRDAPAGGPFRLLSPVRTTERPGILP
jgi:hypothetical protein